MSERTLERLIYMANQIAANQAMTADPAMATAAHIRRYWDPMMRRMIRQVPREALSPAAAAAIDQLAS